jgi:BirA family biotin operon repressor/biotin-[acetyl-CoA-carboxylase] ligase
MKIIRFDEIDSTNSFLHGYHEGDDVETVVAVAEYQTAGRGQGTNHWESERGKNLTFSVRVAPKGVRAACQYVLSMCMALAVKDVLSEYSEGMTVKWPNDIYWNDKKISGTLIETTIAGKNVKTCIFGTGINVNQTEFRSDAPNPVSIKQIVGHEVDREELLKKVMRNLEKYLKIVYSGERKKIHDAYMNCLYRKEGVHKYRDNNGTFEASIERVEDSGHLVLRSTDGRERRYGFKEVTFVL